MRSVLSIGMLICLMAVVQFQPSHSTRQTSTNLSLQQIIQQGLDGLKDQRIVAGKALISSPKFGLGFKAGMLKPFLLIALAKIKLALLFGKPLVLVVIKKLLLHAVLGKLLLKIPLILLGGKALLLTKILAIKFALIAKGLVGLKASLALLFLGGFLKGSLAGSGLTFVLGLAGSLLKLTGHSASQKENDQLTVPFLMQNYVPPRVSVYGVPPSGSRGTSILDSNFGANDFGIGLLGFGSGTNGSGYSGLRSKREAKNADQDGERMNEDSLEESRMEIEAAQTNGNAYLYVAAQFDDQSCGYRLICEVYQRPRQSLTEDEVLLQNIFGYPPTQMSEEEKATSNESYYMAAQLGFSQQGWISSDICGRSYSTCPYDAQQLIQIFVSEDTRVNEIASVNRLVVHAQTPRTSAGLPSYFVSEPITSPVQQWKSNVMSAHPHARSLLINRRTNE